jgi:hypothetical protein
MKNLLDLQKVLPLAGYEEMKGISQFQPDKPIHRNRDTNHAQI